MKCQGIVLSVCLVTVGWLSICHAQFGKLETSWGRTIDTVEIDTIRIPYITGYTAQGVIKKARQRDSIRVTVTRADTISPISFVTSVGMDCFTRESKSGAYKVGLIPGFGYGIKFKPRWWTMTKYLLAGDLFVQGVLSDDLETHEGSDYFNIDILLVITVMDWIGVGLGPRFKIGLEDVPHELRCVFSFGIKKATQ